MGNIGEEGDSGDNDSAVLSSSESEIVAFEVSAPDEVKSNGRIVSGVAYGTLRGTGSKV